MGMSASDMKKLNAKINIPENDLLEPTQEEYIQCCKLYKKFVCNDAYFCINIRYSTRRALSKMVGERMGRKSIVSTGRGMDEHEIEEMAQYMKQSEMSKEQLFHM